MRRSPKGYRGFESLPHRHGISDLRFSILDLHSLILARARDRSQTTRNVIFYLGRIGSAKFNRGLRG
jgi:hypothetical protein